MSALKVVGKRIPPVDGLPKVTGSLQYISDFYVDSMLWGLILRSPLPHARIRKLDFARARKVTGVRAIIGGRDTARVKYGVMKPDEYVLALDKVRYVGDEIAAVAAVSLKAAEEALSLIDLELEPLPPLYDAALALAEGAALIHEDKPRNVAHELEISRGDVEEGFRRSAVVLEEVYEASCVAQSPIECDATVAACDATGNFTFWVASQVPFRHRYMLAQSLQVPISKIRVIQHPMGGSFGSKMGRSSISHIAGELARAARAPVKLLNTREEEFSVARPRVPARIRLRMGVDAEGRITAKETDILADCGAYCDSAPSIVDTMATRPDSLYKIANIRTRARLIYTNKVPTGAFRGYGNPQMTFALEAHLDRLADELGMDPVQLRLVNAPEPGHVSAHGWKLRSCALRECILRASEAIGWNRPAPPTVPGRRRGRGLACMIHVSGNRYFRDNDGSTAIVQVHEDGRARVFTGEGDIGQGTRTIYAQIVAEVLGLDPGDVEISVTDSSQGLIGMGASASRVTTVGGRAVLHGAEEARRQLLEVASELLEARPDDLELVSGHIRVRAAKTRSLPLAKVVERALYRKGGKPITGEGHYDPDTEMADSKTKFGNISSAYSFAAQAVDLEVDPETGEVVILKAVAAHDVGRAINPMTTEGQVEGGLAQGLGYALVENLAWREGKTLTSNFHDYLVYTSLDMPDVETILVEPGDADGPFGAKGVAEPALVPTAPAVHNALFAALGVSVPKLPVTPEDILKGMRGRE